MSTLRHPNAAPLHSGLLQPLLCLGERPAEPRGSPAPLPPTPQPLSHLEASNQTAGPRSTSSGASIFLLLKLSRGFGGGVKKEVETSPAPPGGPKVGRRLLEGSLRNSPQKDHKMMCGPDAKEQSMTQSSCQPCKAGAITHQSINIDSRHHRGPSWASQACGGRGVLGRRDT